MYPLQRCVLLESHVVTFGSIQQTAFSLLCRQPMCSAQGGCGLPLGRAGVRLCVCGRGRERQGVCVCACVERWESECERERERAHSTLAQAPVRENGSLCTAAAWLRLTGEATCGSRTGWQVYRRACTPFRSPTWPFLVGVYFTLRLAWSHPSAREIRFEWKRSNYSLTALQTFMFYFYTPCVPHDLKSFLFFNPSVSRLDQWWDLLRNVRSAVLPLTGPLSEGYEWWFLASPSRIPNDHPPSPEAHRLSEPSKDSQQTDEPRCSVLCRTFLAFALGWWP